MGTFENPIFEISGFFTIFLLLKNHQKSRFQKLASDVPSRCHLDVTQAMHLRSFLSRPKRTTFHAIEGLNPIPRSAALCKVTMGGLYGNCGATVGGEVVVVTGSRLLRLKRLCV